VNNPPNLSDELPEDWETMAEQAEMVESGPDDQMVCPQCFDPIQPLAHLCGKCGGPVSARAMVDPFASIWGEGYAYRQVTKVGSRPSKLLLIGMWVGFVPGILYFFGYILFFGKEILDEVSGVDGDYPGFSNGIGSSLFAMMIMAAMMCLHITILRRVTINYFRAKEPAQDVVTGQMFE